MNLTMNLDNLNSKVSSVCFSGGFVFLVLVLVEELAIWFESSLLGNAYTPETLLLVAAVLFLVVISLVLRQIREELKGMNFEPARTDNIA